MRVIEVEDEHAEARFVASEIAALVERGLLGLARSRSSTGRTRSRRVLEDMLVRQGIAYQVIGGPRFYERAEVKDADRVPPGDRQPVRRRLAAADREPAAARDRRRDASRGCRRYADAQGVSLWEALDRARRRRALGTAQAQGRRGRSGRCCSRSRPARWS